MPDASVAVVADVSFDTIAISSGSDVVDIVFALLFGMLRFDLVLARYVS